MNPSRRAFIASMGAGALALTGCTAPITGRSDQENKTINELGTTLDISFVSEVPNLSRIIEDNYLSVIHDIFRDGFARTNYDLPSGNISPTVPTDRPNDSGFEKDVIQEIFNTRVAETIRINANLPVGTIWSDVIQSINVKENQPSPLSRPSGNRMTFMIRGEDGEPVKYLRGYVSDRNSPNGLCYTGLAVVNGQRLSRAGTAQHVQPARLCPN